ncbi:MAG: TrkA family potassium uptake protein [Clostridia bacterium]|nr:TrkA family potassium uptake protein [Clostridia bacterium]
MKSVGIIGLGLYGRSVLETLISYGGFSVSAYDNHMEKLSSVAHLCVDTKCVDASTEEGMDSIPVEMFDCVVVAIGTDIKASLFATMMCRERGAKRLIAKATDRKHARLLSLSGADMVISPEVESGRLLAKAIQCNNHDVVELFTSGGNVEIAAITVPREWEGKTIIQVDVRKRYDVNIIATRDRDGALSLADTSVPLSPEETLVLIAQRAEMERFLKRYAPR